jgi:integrase
MTTERITKHTVQAAKPAAARYIIFDSTVPGFGLRVYPSGAKSWVFEYRPGEGGRTTLKRRVTIGKVTDLTPDMARREADKLRAQVKTGSDPQGTKTAQRAAPTVAAVAKSFLDHHLKKRAQSTRDYYDDILNRVVLPRVGTRKAKDLTSSEVAALHQSLDETPYFANRVLAVISSMYSYAGGPSALREAKIPPGINPAKGVERFDEQERGRVLSNDELLRLGAAIRLAETEGVPWSIDPEGQVKHVPKGKQATVIGPHAAAALRLLILTGARLREILNLRWDDIDAERGLLIIRKHKTARTAGVKSIVLNAPALDVLAGLDRLGVYVIAGETAGKEQEKPRADLKRPWALVRKQAGLEDLRLHDLRHNFAGFGAGGGAGLLVIGKLLGHSPQNPKTTARYSHLDNDPLRKATNTIGTALVAAMGEPVADTGGDNVIPLAANKAS